MPNQRIYRPDTSMTFTHEEAFEMEVQAATDDFRLDFSRARFAVAERAAVEAIGTLGVWCRSGVWYCGERTT